MWAFINDSTVEDPIRWPYYKILREFSTLKQFYPEIDPYAEVYQMRDNVYACFSESLDGAGDVSRFQHLNGLNEPETL